LKISLYESQTDNTPTTIEIVWGEEFAELFRVHDRKPCTMADCGKIELDQKCQYKKGTAWAPVYYKGTRANSNALGGGFLVFDIDHKGQTYVISLLERLKSSGVAYIIHSTHSHFVAFAGDYCLRLIIPLSREAKPKE
jgi:hypothetical protein